MGRANRSGLPTLALATTLTAPAAELNGLSGPYFGRQAPGAEAEIFSPYDDGMDVGIWQVGVDGLLRAGRLRSELRRAEERPHHNGDRSDRIG